MIDVSDLSAMNRIIRQQLMEINTAFIGKVISCSGDEATVQPLNMIRAQGGDAKKQALITGCPVAKSAGYLIPGTCPTKPSSWRGVSAGDIVICVCCDRDITETRSGKFAAPASGIHSISNAVVIGIL